MTRSHLIITADDFGLAEAVNEAVETAHLAGVLTAASLMVGGAAAGDAIARARGLPQLAVGLHVVIVDGRPTLPPERIPALVDADGLLRSDLARLGLDIACRPAVRRQLRAEIAAQFMAFSHSGLRLAHVDAHKHYHLHPIVAREIIAIGRGFGMRALRIPQPAQSRALSAWTALLRRQARRAGLVTPDAVFGWSWSGAMTAPRLADVLNGLPRGIVEIYCHPATADAFPGHAQGYGYKQELAALLAPQTRDMLRRPGFRLGSYADATL